MEIEELVMNSNDSALIHEPIAIFRQRIQTWMDPLIISYKIEDDKEKVIDEYNRTCDTCYLILIVRRKTKFEEARKACVFGLPTEALWKSLYEEDSFIREFCKIYGYKFPS
jgi:hypothetical protein